MKAGRRFLPVILMTALAAAGCSHSRGGPIPYGVQNFGAPDAPTVVPLGAGYKIGPMDTLSIKVFKMPDLSGDYEVDLTGQISMPLLGNIAAANMTTAQLDQALTQRLGEKYLENPDVGVSIKSSTARMVTVDGAVTRSGSYPVMGPMTLMQAVALAGGTNENANPRRVAVFRTIGGQRQAAAFDLTSIRRGQDTDPPVYAGDIVVIDGSTLNPAQKQLLNSLPILSIFRPF